MEADNSIDEEVCCGRNDDGEGSWMARYELAFCC